jgi:long-chain acyl-CoA synthetase
MTLAHVLGHRALVGGERVAIVDGDQVVSYAALADAAGRVAWMLQARGVRKGDRVAVLLPNCAATGSSCSPAPVSARS